ncbi:MAG: NfeD family protein [Gammaproteobacteria bacterium]|nr:NfeD family protein [Gammaproteobacteria bacterium]
MTWWTWMILGAVLLGAELFAIDAQFYLVFLGVSAALVGLASLLGIAMPEWVQWMAFAALSLISFFTFRKSLYDKIRGDAIGFRETLAGNSIDVSETLAPGAETRLSYRGTKWTARNIGDTEIIAGTRAVVAEVDGLTLRIKAE